jgi:hypothetical protein
VQPLNTFKRGDVVYVVKPGYLVEEQVQLDGQEPLSVVLDRVERGLAYVTDRAGLNWEIPMSVVCGVPEGHVFAADLGSTSEPNPCLACGLEIIVKYQSPNAKY